MNSKLSAIVAATLLLATFCLFTTPISDGDCFWHIATGQWIWDHKALPDTDPFTHTFAQQAAAPDDAARTGFLLKQYWLGQLALAALWDASGSTGIVLFRALAYGAILVFLYRWIRRRHTPPIALLLILPLAFIFRSYPNERPQLFTFLLMPLVLRLLEDLRQSGRPGILHWLALPLSMLVWANCHGGYILGTLLIAIYLATLFLPTKSDKEAEKASSAAVMIAALAVSALNPNGIAAFREIFMMQASAGAVQEFLSPFRAARELSLWFPAYWLFLALLGYTIVARFREICLHHLLTLVLLAALSLTSLRYIPFLLMAVPLLAPYLPQIRASRIAWGSATACYALFLLNSEWRESFTFTPDRLFPAAATGFLSENLPAPELFNFYDWGGYILLKAPGVKTFVDGRALSAAVDKEYGEALWSDRWQEIFARYRISTVLIPAVSKSTGATYPLATNLARSRDWRLVYSDKTALVFVREIPANMQIISSSTVDRLQLQRHILGMLEMIPPAAHSRAEFWVSRGNAQMLLGDYPSAGLSFKKALSIDPANQWAAMMLRQTGGR